MNQIKTKERYAKEYVVEIYNLPLLDLIYEAQCVHRKYQPRNKIKLCLLSNIKSGDCPEDCGYCSQSVHYKTDIEKYKLLSKDVIIKQAKSAKEKGATRFCMGAAWRSVPQNKDFEKVLDLVREVSKLNMEVCCTLGILTLDQAIKLKEAGLTAYNHNLDTSENYYNKIITTRKYKERLETIHCVAEAGIQVCSGGIIGMGESSGDRLELLRTLANLEVQPESVPINLLVKVKGTPLENMDDIDHFELVRIIAVARILMPKSIVRLSAGRLKLSHELQTLCFIAGANSVFIGERLLTTKNVDMDSDIELFKKLSLEVM